MAIDIKKLEALLAEKKLAEAGVLIREAVNAPMTESEKGSALVNYASVYMEAMNRINAEYKAALEEAVKGMKKIDASAAKSADKAKLAEVRAGLQN